MNDIKNELKANGSEDLANVRQELEALTKEIQNNNNQILSLRGKLEEKIRTIGTEKEAFSRLGCVPCRLVDRGRFYLKQAFGLSYKIHL